MQNANINGTESDRILSVKGIKIEDISQNTYYKTLNCKYKGLKDAQKV